MQGRKGIEGTARLFQVTSPRLLNKLCYCPVSTRSIACAWERAVRWSTQLRRKCWVATSLTRWIRC